MDRDQAKSEELTNINSCYDNLRGFLSSCQDGAERRQLIDYLKAIYDLAYEYLIVKSQRTAATVESSGSPAD